MFWDGRRRLQNCMVLLLGCISGTCIVGQVTAFRSPTVCQTKNSEDMTEKEKDLSDNQPWSFAVFFLNFAIDFTRNSKDVSTAMGSVQDWDLGNNMLDQCNLNVCLVESLVDFTEETKFKPAVSYAFILATVHTCNRERRIFFLILVILSVHSSH